MISRREALKKIYSVVVAVGASSFLSFDDLLAMEKGDFKKPNLVWLHASACSGCSTSFLNVEDVPVLDIITKYTNLVFHPDISSATGHTVDSVLEDVEKLKDPVILIMEGSIPTDMPHACMMCEKPMTYWAEKLGKKATAAVSVGTCASFGGITAMKGMVTGSKPLGKFFTSNGIKTPVINIPGCPVKPEHLLYCLFYYLKQGALPELDSKSRPTKFFGQTIHERCIYHDAFMKKKFAKKIGDEGCLFKIGCQGVVTKNDCLITGYNDNENVCIRAGHPCIGCASEKFPKKTMLKPYR